MYSLSRQESVQICPRCKTMLPSNGTVCYTCGLQTTRRQPEPVSQPMKARPVETALSPGARRRELETKKRSRTTLIYFFSISIVIFFVVFAGLRSTGISLSTLISLTKGTTVAPRVNYPAPKVDPLFADNFVADVSGWNLQSSRGNYAVSIKNNAMTMEVDKNKLLWELLPGETSYGDFLLTVNAVLSKGDQNNGYGVYIRGAANRDSDLATYYRFELYGDGSYAIFKGTADQNGKSVATKIVNYTLSPAIQKQGKTNHIVIIAKGPSMSFIVNDHLLKTFSDQSYASGSVALFASNLPEAQPGIQVQFSRFALYPVQVSAPA